MGWIFLECLKVCFVFPEFPPPCWFSLKILTAVNPVTLAFWSIQSHFIRDIRAKFGITNLTQSPDIGQNLDEGISNFRISGQSFINENFHNSGTSHDIDRNLGPVIKLDLNWN